MDSSCLPSASWRDRSRAGHLIRSASTGGSSGRYRVQVRSGLLAGANNQLCTIFISHGFQWRGFSSCVGMLLPGRVCIQALAGCLSK